VLSTNVRTFVDFENGVLFFPDPRPFAPRLHSQAPDSFWFERQISSLLSRRDSLDIRYPDPHTSTGALDQAASNPAIYDDYNPRRDLASTYFIDVEFTAAQAQGEIMLGLGNLLEGSEVVSVGGEQWVRDKDYTIDYDLGRLTLKRQLPTGGQLNVNYSYAPLFQQAGRTLVGSAFRLEGREKSFGGAFMYESKGAQDLRPRLGEEPSRSLITDLNTEWTFRPGWMTRMVDRLPGIRTTAPSSFHVQAEMGMSFPTPNTRNEVFIDGNQPSALCHIHPSTGLHRGDHQMQIRRDESDSADDRTHF
jgi:cell surface protein SprA